VLKNSFEHRICQRVFARFFLEWPAFKGKEFRISSRTIGDGVGGMQPWKKATSVLEALSAATLVTCSGDFVCRAT
jgi:hypothetical protein